MKHVCNQCASLTNRSERVNGEILCQSCLEKINNKTNDAILTNLKLNVLFDTKDEIETISRSIVNHLGGVEQDVTGVKQDLKKVIAAYIKKLSKYVSILKQSYQCS